MAHHEITTRITTTSGDEWIGCECGWVSPPLHGRGVADAAYFLHTLDDELLSSETMPTIV